MSFPKFVSFLKDGLYVSNCTDFEDKWEGLLPIKKMKTDDKWFAENHKLLSPWIYISCWHKSDFESYAMWKIYGQIS